MFLIFVNVKVPSAENSSDVVLSSNYVLGIFCKVSLHVFFSWITLTVLLKSGKELVQYYITGLFLIVLIIRGL